MQDPSDGSMFPIPAGIFEAMRETFGRAPDAITPDLPGVLKVGEFVEIKQCCFRVAAIGETFVRLEGISRSLFEQGCR